MNRQNNNIKGHKFEDLVQVLIKKMGFKTEKRKLTADGGIDLLAINEKPITRGKYVIQCKRYSKPISESIIRDLFGVMTSERANKGILITNSSFTYAAKKFARGKPIELIDGDELSLLLEKYCGLSNSISKKKTLDEIDIPGVYEIAVVTLESEMRSILRKKQKVVDGIIFYEKTFLNREEYILFFQEKLRRFEDLIKVQVNQMNYLNKIFHDARDENALTDETSEVKSFCIEIINVTKKILQDLEESSATVPPDEFTEIQRLIIEAYDHIINKISTIAGLLKDTISNCEGIKSNTNINKELVITIDLPVGWEERMNKAMERILHN